MGTRFVGRHVIQSEQTEPTGASLSEDCGLIHYTQI